MNRTPIFARKIKSRCFIETNNEFVFSLCTNICTSLFETQIVYIKFHTQYTNDSKTFKARTCCVCLICVYFFEISITEKKRTASNVLFKTSIYSTCLPE